MTDRYNSVTVIFEEEIREDDLENWINAIGMMRKVIKVLPGERNIESGKYQAAQEIRQKFFEFWKDIDPWKAG
jgi:hypothetical protein